MGSKKSQSRVVVWLILLFGSAILLIASLLKGNRKKNPEGWIRKTLSAMNKEFTQESIEFWVAVAKVESNDFQSELCVEFFNYMGMGFPSKRPTVAMGPVKMTDDVSEPLFAVYRDYERCAYDLLLWMSYNRFNPRINDLDTFLSEMKRFGYFGASVESYKNRMQDFLPKDLW